MKFINTQNIMILLIDNYDSFAHTLAMYLEELGASVEVRRNDVLSVSDALALKPEGIVLSPGPCTPDQAGLCLDLIKAAGPSVPLLGVCLGHQAIGQAFGGHVVRASIPVHGKTDTIHHDGRGLFVALPSPFRATRYHSLIVSGESLPPCLDKVAWNDEGIVMGLQHRAFPVYGVQFHPESVASEYGHSLLDAFLSVCREFPRKAA